MLWIVLIIAFAVIIYCLLILIAPRLLRKAFAFFSIGSRLYLISLLRITLGVLLLILSTQAKFWGYVAAIGLIAAASGVSVFFFALRRTKKFLNIIQNQSNLRLRFYAVIGLVIWTLLVYSLLPAVPLYLPR